MAIRYLHLFLLIGLITSFEKSLAQLNAKTAAVIDRFGKELSADLSKDNIHAGISVAILKNDKIISLAAFGYANTKDETAADTNTIYRIGSITKTFTATLLLQLVEEGKIKLDDPVENFLPEIKYLPGYADAGQITFRQLASHTSGLKREPDMKNASVGPVDEWEAKVLSCIPYSNFNSRPAQQFLYSNIGYALLGLTLSRVTKVPYMQMVQERIFTPLHMDDSFFILPEDKRSRLAEGIENSNDKINTALPLREIAGRGYRIPNGGIFSTPRDLAKFAMSLMGIHPLLTAQSRKRMQDIPPGGKNYGLGLILFNSFQVDIIGHDGSVPGYTAQFAIEQKSGYAVVLMRNQNKGTTNLEKISYDLLHDLKKAD